MLKNPQWFIMINKGGMLVCHLETPWFSQVKGIREQLLYVDPKYRGTTCVFELLDSLNDIAKQNECSYIISGSSLHPDKSNMLSRIYQSYGFKEVGMIFTKEY